MEKNNLTTNELKVLLVLSSKGRDMFGAEILQCFTDDDIFFPAGSIYNAASNLEKKGLIETYIGEDTHEAGSNRRKYLRITDQGRMVLHTFEEEIARLKSLKQP